MKSYCNEEIIGILKEAEGCLPEKELCRKFGVSHATIINPANKARNFIMGTSINLLRDPNTSLGGTRNPVLCVHFGFCAPSALSSGRSRQLIEVPLYYEYGKNRYQTTL